MTDAVAQARQDKAAVEAAELFARLQGDTPNPRAADEWRAGDSANAQALDAIEGIWGDLDAVIRPTPPAQAAPRRVRSGKGGLIRRYAPQGIAIAASLLLCLMFALLLRPGGGDQYATGVGEQRVVVLDDGTRVTLNTDTRLSVDYDKDERNVRFQHGEAIFDVAHNAARPFLVHVRGDAVRAIGTSFVVRRDADGVEVTLIEGRVGITRAVSTLPEIILDPGDRVVLDEQQAAQRDRPQLDSLTAWRRGELVLKETPVRVAIAEMNRYSNSPIVLRDTASADQRLSGVFRVGHSAEFAATVAALYGLDVETQSQALILSRQAGSR